MTPRKNKVTVISFSISYLKQIFNNHAFLFRNIFKHIISQSTLFIYSLVILHIKLGHLPWRSKHCCLLRIGVKVSHYETLARKMASQNVLKNSSRQLPDSEWEALGRQLRWFSLRTPQVLSRFSVDLVPTSQITLVVRCWLLANDQIRY